MDKEIKVQKEIISYREVAELLDVTKTTIRRMEAKGVLKSYLLDGKKYFKYSEIEEKIFGSKAA